MGGVPEAARAIGVSRPTLYRTLAGEVTPSFQFLEKIKARGFRLGTLLDEDDEQDEHRRLADEMAAVMTKLPPKDQRELREIMKLIAKAKETNQ